MVIIDSQGIEQLCGKCIDCLTRLDYDRKLRLVEHFWNVESTCPHHESVRVGTDVIIAERKNFHSKRLIVILAEFCYLRILENFRADRLQIVHLLVPVVVVFGVAAVCVVCVVSFSAILIPMESEEVSDRLPHQFLSNFHATLVRQQLISLIVVDLYDVCVKLDEDALILHTERQVFWVVHPSIVVLEFHFDRELVVDDIRRIEHCLFNVLRVDHKADFISLHSNDRKHILKDLSVWVTNCVE